jgi:hypothetical protein
LEVTLGLAITNPPEIEDEGQIGPEGLTEKQALFVKALVAGHKQGRAAEMAGYVGYPDSNASRLVRLPHIQRAIQRETERRLLTEGVPAALEFMVKAPGDKKLPGAVRYQCAKWVMEAAGHGLAAQRAALGLPGEDKPLDEMSVGELEQFLAAGQSAIQAIKARDGIIDHDARNVESSTLAELSQVVDAKGNSA